MLLCFILLAVQFAFHVSVKNFNFFKKCLDSLRKIGVELLFWVVGIRSLGYMLISWLTLGACRKCYVVSIMSMSYFRVKCYPQTFFRKVYDQFKNYWWSWQCAISWKPSDNGNRWWCLEWWCLGFYSICYV